MLILAFIYYYLIGWAMTLFTFAAQLCPLCQQDNACAMEQGLAIDACWCAKQTVDMPSVIAQFNATSSGVDLPNNQCVCQSCMAKLVQQSDIDAVETYSP
ncbi:MAG: hypothetical protein COW76_03245 [Shewanella sp. CG18_big_fil_WC_8_21_14_2_50_42_11]|jgi:hypothetical protein|nr:MAG: hypothetical protein COW76_03245 [Shewanella sp. CG18_big_fil_WC_8_21_14_2_50_42_11]PIX73303.1 MAG: hypothetical protein COZ42_00920 [Shewanella sp. CG_4_10_14_3_um_filter_42_91]PIY63960.1 MAG: hypothetical protein COY92_18380 [Shewanella sp. CG_4_10_14_0_8_um_filter_42_13]PJB90362.1 MAG: hypothetical protein CO084_17510 [Shewanella sp. CG_4_9_14_0_8_um_filter_42_14]